LAGGCAFERVGAALEDDGGGAIVSDAVPEDGFEEAEVGSIVNAVLEGHIEGIVLALLSPDLSDIASPREESIAVLVEGDGHDPVSEEERILHSIPVVHINVNVQHSRVISQQLDDRQHNVIDVTKPTPFALCTKQNKTNGEANGSNQSLINFNGLININKRREEKRREEKREEKRREEKRREEKREEKRIEAKQVAPPKGDWGLGVLLA